MPYVGQTYIDNKLAGAIAGLGACNFIGLITLVVILSSDEEATGPAMHGASCAEAVGVRWDGSDDAQRCMDVCLYNPNCQRAACEGVKVAVYTSSDEDEVSACIYTPEQEVGYVPPPPPPPPLLTCYDYDQRAGIQHYPCPPGGLLLRDDSAAAHCLPSLTSSCDASTCCTRVPPPMTCADTDADGTPDSFDCAAPWRRTPTSPEVIPFYTLDAAGICSRSEGCTPMACCTIPPPTTGLAHPVDADTYPATTVRMNALSARLLAEVLTAPLCAGGELLHWCGHQRPRSDEREGIGKLSGTPHIRCAAP